MGTNTSLRRELGKVAAALDENLSDAEMDRLLAERREDVEALLAEARKDRDEGNEAPLEPLHVLLRRARERLKAGR